MKREKKKTEDNYNTLIPILIVIIILLLAVIVVLGIQKDKDKTSKYTFIQDTNTTTNTNENQYISKEQALQIALDNIGLKQSDIYDLSIERDYKYGETVYEIDFDYQQYEYEFYIHAKTGEIIHSFKERD